MACTVSLLTFPQDASAYEALWERAFLRTPFTRLTYLKAISVATGRPLHVWGAWEERRLVAALPLFAVSPFRRALPPPLTPYTEPLLEAFPTGAQIHAKATVLDALIAKAQDHYHAFSLHLPPGWPDARPFTWAGCRTEVLYTYRISLDKPMVLQRVRKREVREVNEIHPAEAQHLAEAVSRSMMRQGRRTPLSEDLLRSCIPALLPNGLALRVEQPNFAASMALLTPEGGFDFLAGGDPGPGRAALLLRQMEHARERGCAFFDLCGANTPSIAEYKRGFGGELTPYTRVVWMRPWGRPLHAIKAWV